ncbi:unnamed protein product [Rotaria sordida]|uniref:Uncharacterized protein n=1 Tax=Rotaria sordida TaxID=392033 RepID=A0A818UFY8_9BILA|nr:unnamed protein product [Rotaria sordida]CAF0950046.1 unnamed protein product [Rotaria sordida]CAF1036949.1 unnamed protein product [Rotaria sordida]CAF1180195.1 unnamed protein product [Rotaria sordida]CAF3694451.1 unnamed protein product [Rotaria sordida]
MARAILPKATNNPVVTPTCVVTSDVVISRASQRKHDAESTSNGKAAVFPVSHAKYVRLSPQKHSVGPMAGHGPSR